MFLKGTSFEVNKEVVTLKKKRKEKKTHVTPNVFEKICHFSRC